MPLFNVDSKKCKDSVDVIVYEPIGTVLTAMITEATSGTNGAIDLSSQFGTGAHSFLWSPGTETTEDLDSLPVGSYMVTSTDRKGCSASKTFTVNLATSARGVKSDTVSVYPNPSNGSIYFSGIENIISLTITDYSCKVVVNKTSDFHNIKQLSTGAYVIRMELNTGSSKIEKLIVK